MNALKSEVDSAIANAQSVADSELAQDRDIRACVEHIDRLLNSLCNEACRTPDNAIVMGRLRRAKAGLLSMRMASVIDTDGAIANLTEAYDALMQIPTPHSRDVRLQIASVLRERGRLEVSRGMAWIASKRSQNWAEHPSFSRISKRSPELQTTFAGLQEAFAGQQAHLSRYAGSSTFDVSVRAGVADLSKAIEILKALLTNDDDLQPVVECGMALKDRGTAYSELDEPLALADYNEALSLLQQLPTADGTRETTLAVSQSLLGRAILLRKAGNMPEATLSVNQAIEVLKSTDPVDQQRREFKVQMACHYFERAAQFRSLGRGAEAQHDTDTARAILGRKARPRPTGA